MELEEQDKRLHRLREALQVGLEQIERGEVVSYTPELREQIKQNAFRKFREGRKPNADVTPKISVKLSQQAQGDYEDILLYTPYF